MSQYKTSLASFLDNSQRLSNNPFLHQPDNGQWKTLSFSDVEQQARTIASGLLNKGLVKGDRVGILAKNTAEWFVVDLAIMMAGMISVPIYATAGANTIAYVIKHSEMKAMFVGKLDSTAAAEQTIPKDLLTISFPYPTMTCQTTWQQFLDDNQPLQDIHTPELEDCMSIVYTSGTTGNPKGVVVSYLNLASAAHATVNAINATEADRVLSYLPLAHITERCVVECLAFESALQVFFVESLDTFIDNLHYTQPTFFLSVPRLWTKFQSQVLAQMPQRKLNWLLPIPFVGKYVAKKIRTKLGLAKARVFASGSAPISIDVLNWFERIGVRISEGWGMTETSGLSCGNFPYESKRLGTIGAPVDCVEMKLSEEGEILIKGDGIFNEYYLNPVVTEESFVDGWFKTGDKGEKDSDGTYKIVGRIKEQFKTSKGKYVAPVPIENKLGRNSDVEQACVMGLGMKQPIALVVLAEGIDRFDKGVQLGLEATIDSVNTELESHQRLDYIYICKEAWTTENELLTPTLKLKRNDIEKTYLPLLPKSAKGVVAQD